ncbi:LytR family transcriptional regulator [Peribacillus saganii]|uniref:LytR family transcriptional regulator n=1 Tax=Peribacillus saganii TaxID=2303992 RepID=A0A372LP98_9BACI|nr:LCP family protein [Peribacillus saganii]RFU68310.1 LytR family transcriptional regulator [Peribacillus saganii]
MEQKTRRVYRVRKKKKRLRRFVAFLSIVLLLAIGFGGYIFYQTYSAASDSFSALDRGTKSDLREEKVHLSKNPVSILFLGVEDYSTKGEAGRTDSIIVGTFNPDLKTMKLVSIPRDTRTYIPAKDRKGKINGAYNEGKDSTIDTVEHLLDIPIDYYATVNFEGFKEIVDELGGVEVQVPFDFWEYTDTFPREKIYFEEGPATLDGEEALAYARMRKRDDRGDYGRNDRQKEIIKASIDSMVKPANLLKIDDIAKHVGDNVETNIKMSEGIAFLNKYKTFNSDDIETLTLEGGEDRIGGAFYFIPSDESLQNVQNELKKHLDMPVEEDETEESDSQNEQ